jgi:hypothetical protein
MTRPFIPYFNPSRPVYVKQNGLQAAGKIWKQGERFQWEFFGVPMDRIQQMYFSDMLYHNEDFEEEAVKNITIGDGLDELTIDQLHVLVDNINFKVKGKTKTSKEFLMKKCPKLPKDREMQIRRIRRWRNTYGEMEI